MSINLSVPTETGSGELKPRITVIGVGGAGGNAVNNMIQMGLEGVEFVVANSDAQALSHSSAERRIQMGTEVTRGLGAGSNPAIGQAAADESLDEIMAHLRDSNMVFVTAGLGGGTGTGAAPVIAKSARDQGILTVGVVTKPFQFEGSNRMKIAEAGLGELQQYVDTLLVIPNQNLFRVANEKTTFADAFKMADDVLYSGVRGVTDLMVMPGLINLDFADIKSVMSEMGKAMMGTGEAEGERRAIEAAEAAIANPLLDDTSMHGAQGVLINITAGSDITLFEVDEAANRIRDEVAEDANIIFGSTFEEGLEGRVRVSVVATGIESATGVRPRPVTGPIADPVGEPIATSIPVPPRPELEQVSTEVEVSSPEIEYRPEKSEKSPEQKDLIDQVTANNEASAVGDQDHSKTTIKEDVFIPAPAVDTSATPEKSADPFAAAEIMNAGNSQGKDRSNKKPRLTLFERVTGVTIGERKKERKERVMPPPPVAVQPSGISEKPNFNPITEVITKADIVTEGDAFPEAVPAIESVRSDAAPVPKAGQRTVPEQNNQHETLKENSKIPLHDSAPETFPADKFANNVTEGGLIDGATAESILGNPQEEEDLLDIPAFLRRQAN